MRALPPLQDQSRPRRTGGRVTTRECCEHGVDYLNPRGCESCKCEHGVDRSNPRGCAFCKLAEVQKELGADFKKAVEALPPAPRTQLTLVELRNALSALLERGAPPGALVFTEGCDCTGQASDVTYAGGEVEIGRL